VGNELVLIVDDDDGIREALADMLVDEGYQVALASDGLFALEYLRTHPAPAVVLLDWMMPRCDGATFREQQVADPALRDIPVILLTADARFDDKMRALDVPHSLRKPIKIDDLLALLVRVKNS
jgi:two-component system chemotaxis response regulator CheY